ncbi:MAG: IS630 transposase-related protein [Planctomycetaceae bacterium]
MKAYSMDLRKRVLAMCDAGHGTADVARVLNVSSAWVRRLKQRRREDGTIAPRACGGDRVSKICGQALTRLHEFVQEQPGATLPQLQERCGQELGIHCSVMAVWRACRKLGLSLKKKR